MEKQFQCSICDRKYRSETHLKQHMHKIPCPICGREYTHQGIKYLILHLVFDHEVESSKAFNWGYKLGREWASKYSKMEDKQ